MPEFTYMSKEWKAEEWRIFEETQIAGDTSDCGGWGPDGPCGGCARCMRDQFGYYLMKEESYVRLIQRAGLEIGPLLTATWEFGASNWHDAYRCNRAEEIEGYFFPWEKRDA